MEYDVQALSIEETRRRKTLSDEARNMVKQSLAIEEEDDAGLMMMFEKCGSDKALATSGSGKKPSPHTFAVWNGRCPWL